eukprot:m.310292 g.310292  ORF g.310292 m.310292 type:complete len:265 (+) comp50681_c0_seq1:49-843(+)
MQPAFQFLILLCLLPAQLLISRLMTPSASERTKLLQTFGRTLTDYHQRAYKWAFSLADADSWKKWVASLREKRTKNRQTKRKTMNTKSRPRHVDSVENVNLEEEKPSADTSPAKEVFKMNQFREKQYQKNSWQPSIPEEHFTSSRKRRKRKGFVKYRVGQVVYHKRWGYRGVIVGWDEYAKAPDFWLRMNHPFDKPEWRRQPNYAVLVDTQDRPEPQETYIPQDNIEIITNTKIKHPDVSDYFDSFDGAQYLPSEWLREMYPED